MDDSAYNLRGTDKCSQNCQPGGILRNASCLPTKVHCGPLADAKLLIVWLDVRGVHVSLALCKIMPFQRGTVTHNVVGV